MAREQRNDRLPGGEGYRTRNGDGNPGLNDRRRGESDAYQTAER
ncbi:hypothetical protein [Haladaptatus halobius]|nr:hypothetical protein [Haladaptatus halobius]